jgi:anti-sigma factor RsiW
MADCTNYRPLIGSREGELAAAEANALAAHLAGCDGCRRWAASLAVTEGLVSEALLAAASRRDFTDFAAQVQERIALRRLGPVGRLARAIRNHPWWTAAGTLVPVTAAALLALFVQYRSTHDLADARTLEVSAQGGATTIIQSSDGPVVLIDDDDDEET